MAFRVVACLFCLIALAGGIRVDRDKALKELKAWKAAKAAAGAADPTGNGEVPLAPGTLAEEDPLAADAPADEAGEDKDAPAEAPPAGQAEEEAAEVEEEDPVVEADEVAAAVEEPVAPVVEAEEEEEEAAEVQKPVAVEAAAPDATAGGLEATGEAKADAGEPAEPHVEKITMAQHIEMYKAAADATDGTPGAEGEAEEDVAGVSAESGVKGAKSVAELMKKFQEPRGDSLVQTTDDQEELSKQPAGQGWVDWLFSRSPDDASAPAAALDTGTAAGPAPSALPPAAADDATAGKPEAKNEAEEDNAGADAAAEPTGDEVAAEPAAEAACKDDETNMPGTTEYYKTCQMHKDHGHCDSEKTHLTDVDMNKYCPFTCFSCAPPPVNTRPVPSQQEAKRTTDLVKKMGAKYIESARKSEETWKPTFVWPDEMGFVGGQ